MAAKPKVDQFKVYSRARKRAAKAIAESRRSIDVAERDLQRFDHLDASDSLLFASEALVRARKAVSDAYRIRMQGLGVIVP